MSLLLFDEFGTAISPDGGRAAAATVGMLLEALWDSGELGIDAGSAACDLLSSSEIIANCFGLCGSIRVCR